MGRPTLFLDRDGVINVDHAYVHRQQDVQFIDGIFNLVATAVRSGYLVVVVTNQAGIGRGYYTEETFLSLMFWMGERFTERSGRLDKVYFCPYHPEHGLGAYRKDSPDRKPHPGMFLRAQKELGIDMSRSIMVGDKLSDIQAAQAAGVAKLFLLGHVAEAGEGTRISHLSEVMPHLEGGGA